MEFLIDNFAEVLFYALAALTIAGGIGVITLKNPVHSALALLWTFLMVAALFILRHAEFLAAVQVLVYTGGILVLFLFVIMLVNLEIELTIRRAIKGWWWPVAFGAGAFAALIFFARRSDILATHTNPSALPEANTAAVGKLLLVNWLLPFEIVSVLLLVAMVGAILLNKKEV